MSLSWLGKWFANPAGPESPAQNLALISSTQNPVRVEIEQTLIRFDAHVTLRSMGRVIVSKPDWTDGSIQAGSYVRLRASGDERRDARLQVVLPHYNLANGQSAFICRLTQEFQVCRRRNERYRTVQYKNVRVKIGANPYRLADISATGLRFLVTGFGASASFPLGQDVRPATLILGSGVSVRLERLVPRSHQQGAVGCEIKVADDRDSQTYFKHLIDLMGRANGVRNLG